MAGRTVWVGNLPAGLGSEDLEEIAGQATNGTLVDVRLNAGGWTGRLVYSCEQEALAAIEALDGRELSLDGTDVYGAAIRAEKWTAARHTEHRLPRPHAPTASSTRSTDVRKGKKGKKGAAQGGRLLFRPVFAGRAPVPPPPPPPPPPAPPPPPSALSAGAAATQLGLKEAQFELAQFELEKARFELEKARFELAKAELEVEEAKRDHDSA